MQCITYQNSLKQKSDKPQDDSKTNSCEDTQHEFSIGDDSAILPGPERGWGRHEAQVLPGTVNCGPCWEAEGDPGFLKEITEDKVIKEDMMQWSCGDLSLIKGITVNGKADRRSGGAGVYEQHMPTQGVWGACCPGFIWHCQPQPLGLGGLGVAGADVGGYVHKGYQGGCVVTKYPPHILWRLTLNFR